MSKGETTARQERILRERVRGRSWSEIGASEGISADAAARDAERAVGGLAAESADSLRSTTELRLDSVIEKATSDLTTARTQGERSTLYGVILRAEAQRASLLGLNLRGGGTA